ncbi:MAG: transcription termination/antitermination protein NusG [Candidatus Margulisiibacteriota bacterium]
MTNQPSNEAQIETEYPRSTATATEPARFWYILQCYSNHENKVRDRIQQLIDDKVFNGKVARVLVPQEETVEIRNNKRVESTARIFPGYVFVEAAMDDEVGFEIRRIPGVVKFMGTKFAPSPVTENEILKVLRKVGDKSKKIEVDFEMGEVVKVVDGAFRGYSGPISDISPERGKLKALISIFGRETPVELDFDHVEKIVN